MIACHFSTENPFPEAALGHVPWDIRPERDNVISSEIWPHESVESAKNSSASGLLFTQADPETEDREGSISMCSHLDHNQSSIAHQRMTNYRIGGKRCNQMRVYTLGKPAAGLGHEHGSLGGGRGGPSMSVTHRWAMIYVPTIKKWHHTRAAIPQEEWSGTH